MNNHRDIEIFCHNVAFLRKQHKLSRKEMAKRLEIGVWCLTRIEQGLFPPRLGCNVVFCVYKQFGIRPSQLFSSRLERV